MTELYWILKIWKSGFSRGVNSDVKKSHANYVKAYFQSSLTQICIYFEKSNFAQLCKTKYTWLCTLPVSKLKKCLTELIMLKILPIINRLFSKEILHYGKYTLWYFVFVLRGTKAQILVFNLNLHKNIFIYRFNKLTKYYDSTQFFHLFYLKLIL